MSYRYVQVGKLLISLTHLKCLRREELEQWVGGEEARKLISRAQRHLVLVSPAYAELAYSGGKILLSPGLTLVSGLDFTVEPDPLRVSQQIDDDLLWHLLIEVPKLLDVERAPILVEDLDYRFTRHAREGVMYALDIMERVSSVYRVPFIVTGSIELLGMWSWLHTVARVYDEKGRSIVLVNGEPRVVMVGEYE